MRMTSGRKSLTWSTSTPARKTISIGLNMREITLQEGNTRIKESISAWTRKVRICFCSDQRSLKIITTLIKDI